MNVTFKGMQNVGCYFKQYNNDPENRKERLAIQLNNKGTKDLDEFKDVLETHPGFQESDFLDMDFRSYPNRLNPYRQITDVFINSKPLELSNKNIPIFVKINNLLKRISKGEEIPTTENYIQSDACTERFNSETYGKHRENQIAHLSNIHYEGNARTGSKEISKKLTSVIKDFCESDIDPFTDIKSVCGFSFDGKLESIDRIQLDLKPEDSKIFKDFLDQYLPISNIEGHFPVTIDVYRCPGLKKPIISINQIPVEMKNENFPMLRKISELLNKISDTKNEIQFPRDYLSPESFNEMSKEFLIDDYLENLYILPEDKREERGVALTVITSNSEAKEIAQKIDTAVKKEILATLNI